MEYKIGNVYSFTTIAPDILGKDYTDMTLVAVSNFDIVTKLGFDASTKHKQVYSMNEYADTYKTPDSYEYLIFETKNGDQVIMGMPWIIESTIDELYGIDVYITFNDISLDDLNVILSQINNLGYGGIEIIEIN